MVFHSLKIGPRLAVSFALMIALLLASASVSTLFGSRLSFALLDYNRVSTNIVSIKDALLTVRHARALTWYYLATNDPQALTDRDRAFQKYDKQMSEILSSIKRPETVRLVNLFNDSVASYFKKIIALTGMRNLGVSNTDPAYLKLVTEVTAAQKNYAAQNDDLIKYYIGRVAEATDVANDTVGQSKAWTFGLGVIGVLVGIACAWAIGRGITKPIKAMTKAMGTIASGDLTMDVPGLRRHDEIGEMAEAVQVFKDNAVRLVASEANAAGQRQEAERERRVNEVTRAENQQRQEAVVDALAGGLERLSKGDLTGRLQVPFSPEYEKLRADFNATADSLQDALRSIATATQGISSGSDQIAQASDDLSRRTEQQAASLEETAAALNVITKTVTTMATNAGHAAKVATATRDAAETSGGIVRQAIEAMRTIKDSSNQIGSIIGVIDEIAFQTNLLALNAGVEAARAGDAGRGFAVVASEVRGLAQRSAEAAKEIKALISASSVQVEGGVVLVGRTGEALKGIVEKIAEMDALVRQISASSNEQATGLGEVNVAVTQMDQVVQQNAAMVEETTAAAHALKNELQGLGSLVDRFRVEQAEGRTSAPPGRRRAA